MRHKTLDGIIEDLRKISENLDEMIDEDMTLTESWIPIEDFDSDFEGLCWVLLNGVATEAFRRDIIAPKRRHYYFERIQPLGPSFRGGKDITHVIPLHKPAPPNGK